MIHKIWRDPVWSKVIATAVISVAVALSAYVFDAWPALSRYLYTFVGFLAAESAVSNWVMGLLLLLTIPTIFLMGAIVWVWLKPVPEEQAPWREYTTDVFFGLRWRWRYLGKGEIYELHAFCAACDYQVFAVDISSSRVLDHIAFHCDSCGRRLAEFQEPVRVLESKVQRFIQQKLRSGSWTRMSLEHDS